MAEDFIKITGTKSEIYQALIPQIQALVGAESDFTANQANIAAAVKESFDFLWVRFYNVKSDSLVLGPFQGPVACTRIKKGNGVCGKAWAEKRPVVVDNVNLFPGHIACSSKSKSEIVIPLIKECEVVGVLDIDSEQLAAFNNEDLLYLNEICEWFVNTL